MALITIRDKGRLMWYGWKNPLPSDVIAAESLWILWRENFLKEVKNG
jgi:hypothetical protein